MIITAAQISIAVEGEDEWKKFAELLRTVKSNINVTNIEMADTNNRAYILDGSYEAISEVTKLLLPSCSVAKQWLFIRYIKTKEKVAICPSRKEFEKMVSPSRYQEFEYKSVKIVNIDLMTIDYTFYCNNKFSDEIEGIFKSDIGWKPIQRTILWG